MAAGRKAWESEWNFDKEDKELEHQLVLGGVAHVRRAARRAAARRRGRATAGTTTETTRFGRYARRLWDGLLAYEEVDDR